MFPPFCVYAYIIPARAPPFNDRFGNICQPGKAEYFAYIFYSLNVYKKAAM